MKAKDQPFYATVCEYQNGFARTSWSMNLQELIDKTKDNLGITAIEDVGGEGIVWTREGGMV